MNEAKQLTLIKFGKKVSNMRADKGLSLRQLEMKCHIGHANLSRIENGKLNITLTTLVDLANGLGVSPRILLDF